MAKSYWEGVVCDGPRSREAVKSWFSPLCDEMTPIKAQCLSDIETGKTKKLKVLMQYADGRQRWVIRTFGNRFSITMKPVLAGAR